MEVLRDSIWQFVGAIFALLAIVSSVAIWFSQRSKKRFAFGLLSSRRLLSTEDEIAKRITLAIDGNPVRDVKILLVGFKNIGNLPVAASEFERSPTVIFDGDTRVLAIDLAQRRPDNLRVESSSSPELVAISPLLLNAGEYFTIQIIVSGPAKQVTSDIRIAGVDKIEQLNEGTAPDLFQLLGTPFLVLLLLVLDLALVIFKFSMGLVIFLSLVIGIAFASIVPYWHRQIWLQRERSRYIGL